MNAALRAERLTVFATPATRILFAAAVLMSTVSMTSQLVVAEDLQDSQTIEVAMHAATVATMIFAAIAGIYSATTDHRFGITDQRLLSSPSRRLVFAAKSVMAGVLGVLYGLAGSVTAIVVASIFYAAEGESFDVTSGLVGRAIIGIVIAAPLLAVIGVAIGTLVRNQPMAMGGTLVWLLIIEPPVILGFAELGKWFPGAAGLALTNAPDPALIRQPLGALSLGIYALVFGALALWRFERADI